MVTWDQLQGFVLGGGLTALVGAVAKIYESWRKARVENVLDAAGDIYAAMDSCLMATGLQRIVVLSAHNGGGDLDPGTPIYSSVLYEVMRDKEVGSVRDRWQRQLLDRPYVELLHRVADEGKALVRTEDLPPDSILRGVYEHNGIEKSIVVRLELSRPTISTLFQGRPKVKMKYVSFAMDGRVDESDLEEEVRVCVSRIQNILNRV